MNSYESQTQSKHDLTLNKNTLHIEASTQIQKIKRVRWQRQQKIHVPVWEHASWDTDMKCSPCQPICYSETYQGAQRQVKAPTSKWRYTSACRFCPHLDLLGPYDNSHGAFLTSPIFQHTKQWVLNLLTPLTFCLLGSIGYAFQIAPCLQTEWSQGSCRNGQRPRQRALPTGLWIRWGVDNWRGSGRDGKVCLRPSTSEGCVLWKRIQARTSHSGIHIYILMLESQ